MATGPRPDPYGSYKFLVEIDSITQAGFQECSGLETSSDVVEYREGTDPNHVRKLSGLTKFSPITLKRGITDSDELWKWRQSVIDGKIERRNCSIVLLDDTGTEKIRWNCREVWPSKWTGPQFNATANGTAVEALELQTEEVNRS